VRERLYTARQVAEEVGVSPSTIRTWVSRHGLQPADRQGRFPLYRLSDAMAAEASRNRKHRRRA
jgi:DNA-binding transcriptional MerR regulator